MSLLPVVTFRAWMRTQLIAEGVWDEATEKPISYGGVRSINEIAEDWGLSPRTILRIMRGQQHTMADNRIDQVFCRAGEPGQMLECYPITEDERGRYDRR